MERLRTCMRDGCARRIKRNASRYCSLRCQFDRQHEQYIAQWKAGEVDGTTTSFGKPSLHIRRYLLEAADYKCSACGWNERHPKTGVVPLHLDHIDGNAQNNRPENLRLLCPNCHALTETYGNSNKGNGRPGRRARYLKGVKFSPFIYEFAG